MRISLTAARTSGSRHRRPRRRPAQDVSPSLTLEDAEYPAQPPATSYVFTLDGGIESADGQTLGYTWVGPVDNWHRTAFTSFGDGHGVWESSGGTVLPFYARNLFTVKHEEMHPTDKLAHAGDHDAGSGICQNAGR